MKISVITVCLNADAYIGKTLSSVAEQSWHDVEHIVVDGGSADNTLQILEKAADRNLRLRFSSSPDSGISDAMNNGVAQATGSLVCFLHADDFFADNGVLERVALKFIEHPAIEWLTGGIHHVDKQGQIIRSFLVRRWSYSRLLRGNIIFHPATFLRRELLLDAGGFDAGLRYAMDYDLWLRLGKTSAPYLLDQPLACFRLHDSSCSVSQVDAAFREEFAVRCRYLADKPLQKALHCIYYALKFFPNRLSVRHDNGI